MGKRVYITSAHQCPRGRLDVARLFKYFRANGWEITDDLASADLVVAGGCAFTLPVEKRSIRHLTEMKQQMRPGAPLLVCGCIAAIQQEGITETVQGVPADIVGGKSLDRLISARVPLITVDDANSMDPALEVNYNLSDTGNTVLPSEIRPRSFISRRARQQLYGKPQTDPNADYGELFYIRTVRGCLEECSYCGIKLASGDLRSKPADAILREFERGLAAGYKAFNLVGEDVGAYGQDHGASIVDLLSLLLNHDGEFRLVIPDCNPRWAIRYAAELSELLSANATKIGHIEIPVQSGSDRILGLMRRKYTSEDLLACISALRAAAPSIRFKSHILVGFPGETSSDFNQTLQLMQKARFDHVTCYRYSDRPGTDSYKYPDKVPPWTKLFRHWRCDKALAPSR